MKKLFVIFTAAALFAACNSPMPRGDWSKAPYKALCHLMNECKAEAGAAGRNVNYAVFDYDNTTVMSDVELAAMSWQIENLRFKFGPSRVHEIFSRHIPDLDSVLVKAGAEGISARMLLDDLASDYAAMLSAAGVSCGEELSEGQLSEVQAMPEFADFRVKLWGLYEGVYHTFDYREGFFIIAGMFDGFTYPELDAMVKEAVRAQVAKGRIQDIVWESPDMGKAGKVRYEIPDGLALSREMRSLYSSLKDNGIDVYVFSASMEAAVEAMACDPEYLGLDTSRVFALRMRKDSTGLVLQEYQPGYVRPYKEGKTEAIKAYVAPLYDGRGPVLVGGDSVGDLSMLTSFPDMRVGLIIDKGQKGPGIGELRQKALDAENGGEPSRYVLQRRDDAHARFSRR
ncbi:MAG: hypothetical protein IJ222_03235 [Bacteroidales bacterium]|nr:hypothetical protein [Bacteroidales bacterium]